MLFSLGLFDVFLWFNSDYVSIFLVHAAWHMGGISVPRPGMEPVSSALESRVFTTGPSGKSQVTCFFSRNIIEAMLCPSQGIVSGGT